MRKDSSFCNIQSSSSGMTQAWGRLSDIFSRCCRRRSRLRRWYVVVVRNVPNVSGYRYRPFGPPAQSVPNTNVGTPQPGEDCVPFTEYLSSKLATFKEIILVHTPAYRAILVRELFTFFLPFLFLPSHGTSLKSCAAPAPCTNDVFPSC